MIDRAVPKLVRRTRPNRWLFFRRPTARRVAAVRDLEARAKRDPAAEEALRGVWDMAWNGAAEELLQPIAEAAGGLPVGAWLPRLTAALDLAPTHPDGPDVRHAAVGALAELGAEAFGILIERLMAPGAEGAGWALFVLREHGLGTLAAELCSAYSTADEDGRRRLLERLSSLGSESWEDLADLLAGALQRLPNGPRLAAIVVERIGRDEAERRLVVSWSRNRTAAARTVLERLFHYTEEAFE